MYVRICDYKHDAIVTVVVNRHRELSSILGKRLCAFHIVLILLEKVCI